jgi:hypothetical protein
MTTSAINQILFAVLGALQAADVVTTWRILRSGGRELNPVYNLLIDKLGALPALLLIKVPVVIGIGIATYFFQSLWFWTVILAACCTVYAFVVYHNYKVIGGS